VCTEVLSIGHVLKDLLQSNKITHSVGFVLSNTELEFLLTRTITTRVTPKKLVVRHDLEESSDIVIDRRHVEIATFVAECMEPFIVNEFGKVVVEYLCQLLL